MNYELAKELKDAGFPQDLVSGYYLSFKGNKILCSNRATYVPTLSELIEACPHHANGGNFSLTYIGFREKWLAGYEQYEVFTPECWGESPEEAVARLWLALHAPEVKKEV